MTVQRCLGGYHGPQGTSSCGLKGEGCGDRKKSTAHRSVLGKANRTYWQSGLMRWRSWRNQNWLLEVSNRVDGSATVPRQKRSGEGNSGLGEILKNWFLSINVKRLQTATWRCGGGRRIWESWALTRGLGWRYTLHVALGSCSPHEERTGICKTVDTIGVASCQGFWRPCCVLHCLVSM